MVARLTFGQMARATAGVKKFIAKQAKQAKKDPFDIRIKKTGWKKPFFPKSKIMPEYSPYDAAVELGAAGLVVGGYAGYKKLTKDKKKKKKG